MANFLKDRSWVSFVYDKPPQWFLGASGGGSEASASMIFRLVSGWLRNLSKFRVVHQYNRVPRESNIKDNIPKICRLNLVLSIHSKRAYQKTYIDMLSWSEASTIGFS